MKKQLPQHSPMIPVGFTVKRRNGEKKGQWVEIAPGRKRLVTPSAKRLQSERYAKPGGGRSTETWEEERYRKLYGEQMIVCEDLKAKHMRGTPGYAILPDGREGPLPFKSKAARRDYLKAAGFRESGGWE